MLADEFALDPLCAWLTDPAAVTAGRTVHACTLAAAARYSPLSPAAEDDLPEWRVDEEAHTALLSALGDCDTLITCGSALETATAVSSDLLRRLADGRPEGLWLQLGRIELPMAAHLAERARAAGVAFVHAPYLQPVRGRDRRPTCVIFADQDDAGLSRARSLLETLARSVHWMGWLSSSGPARWVNDLSAASRAPRGPVFAS
ncbi:hypothetical protein AN218_13070 [Streptomyces nanshensis]|uniref:Uncharacterized protein n=1 Tax=Streptomyces nanshensis TaxID=518642 RepID=A0A1E7L5E9_9ACTN|nr:hypothetical protein AN218_13070 [Streptomyces nanshensis]